MEPFMALPISLPQRGSRQLLRDLHRQLRAAITNGRLRPGARLPSTRTLAASRGVSRNTAVAAYELLLSEGYVAARGGSGTRVADSLPLPPTVRTAAGAPGNDRRLNRVWRGRAPAARANDHVVLPYSFQIGIPDPRSFPAEVWRRLSARVLGTVRLQSPMHVHALGAHYMRRPVKRGLLFGYGAIEENAIAEGLWRLRRVLRLVNPRL